MIKIKRKGNPDLKGREYINDDFILFLEVIVDPNQSLQLGKEYLAQALTHKNIGFNKCKDCKNVDYNCICEYCEECQYNRCMCDITTKKKLYDCVLKLSLRYLNNEQKIKFMNRLLQMNNLEINKNILLENLIKKLQKSINY